MLYEGERKANQLVGEKDRKNTKTDLGTPGKEGAPLSQEAVVEHPSAKVP